MSNLMKELTNTGEVSTGQLLADILHTAMRTHTNTNRCVFVTFSGHVDLLEISIRESQKNYSRVLMQKTIHTQPMYPSEMRNPELFKERLHLQLNQIKNVLESFIHNGIVCERTLADVMR